MNKITPFFIVFMLFLITNLGCGGKPTISGPSPTTSPSPTTPNSTTSTTPTGPTFAKCADVVDMTVCTKAIGTSGQALGCVKNVYTGKCVAAPWKMMVEKNQCGEVSSSVCNEHNNVQIAELTNGQLVPIGLCRPKASTSVCEEAPLESTARVQSCVANPDVAILTEAAEEICSKFQTLRGTDTSRTPLTAYNCEDIMLATGPSGRQTFKFCQNSETTKACTAHPFSQADIDLNSEPYFRIKFFCRDLVREVLFAQPGFSNLVKREDDSLCGHKAFHTVARPDYNGQVVTSGTIEEVCVSQ